MSTRRVAKKTPAKKRKNTAPKKATQKATNTQAPNTKGKNDPIYALFVEYMALPSTVRPNVFNDPDGNPIETQQQFAKVHGIDPARLSEYKRTDEYVDRVSRIRRRYFKGEIGDAIHSVLLTTIRDGKGADLKVLLEYAKEVERDDPLGETSETLNSILKKLDKIIPG